MSGRLRDAWGVSMGPRVAELARILLGGAYEF
jgi:hypothetical protein